MPILSYIIFSVASIQLALLVERLLEVLWMEYKFYGFGGVESVMISQISVIIYFASTLALITISLLLQSFRNNNQYSAFANRTSIFILTFGAVTLLISLAMGVLSFRS